MATLVARALAVSIAIALGATPGHAYNSEEHKLLIDRAAARLRIDPAIVLPAQTGLRVTSAAGHRGVHQYAKHLAVGYSTNDSTDYSDQVQKVQDNSYWTGFGQREYNFHNYIPFAHELSDTALEVASFTGSDRNTFSIGELGAIYGDYRRTTHCVNGDCHLTNAPTTILAFELGTDCFGFSCGWRPDPVSMRSYLETIANGLVPPFGSLGNVTGNTAADDQYDDAGWWGDEMVRIGASNDWHFSSAAVAWYVGMHRLALHYVDLARGDPRYWNHALHYEANGLHSFTDLFAFGHVVTHRDRTSRGIMSDEGLLARPAYLWMENVIRVGGGTRDGEGWVLPSADLPAVTDATPVRNDFLPSYAGDWSLWGVQEKDFHDAFNAGGATVRNLLGDRFVIQGDGYFEHMQPQTREIIVEGVRASLQSLFDAFAELGRGRTVAQIAAPGSPFFAALRSLPVFVESNRLYTFEDSFGIDWTIGNNFTGRWTRYAEAVDGLAGVHVFPTGTTCLAQRVNGEMEFDDLAVYGGACDTFPAIPPPTPLPASPTLAQNVPNPFDVSTSIRFVLPREARARLVVFDLRGNEVATLLDGVRPAGPTAVTWDGATGDGERARPGVYFYRLTVEGRSQTRRAALIR